MNAHFELDFSRLSERADLADADIWARTRAVAAAIADADLDHETDVVRCLYRARFTAREFMPILDEAIELAREARKP